MRRKDREIADQQEMVAVMRKCEVCRLAFNDTEKGYPYIVPLNFALEVEGETVSLLFHSALEGKKVELIRQDARVAFEMDCGHGISYKEEKGYCTFLYESVVGWGRISILGDTEKKAALDRIMAQYHGGKAAAYNPAAIPRTLVYRLTIEGMTGKHHLAK